MHYISSERFIHFKMFSLVYIDGWRIDSKYVCMYPERPSITADYEGIIAALMTMKKQEIRKISCGRNLSSIFRWWPKSVTAIVEEQRISLQIFFLPCGHSNAVYIDPLSKFISTKRRHAFGWNFPKKLDLLQYSQIGKIWYNNLK